MRSHRLVVVPLLAAILAPTALSGQSDLAGRWEGSMEREGEPVSLAFDLTREGGGWRGRFTSMPQRVMEYPLDSVAFDPPDVQLFLGGGAVVFDGRLARDSLTGSFREGEGRGTFRLARVPSPSLPYTAEDIRFENGDVTLAGSLYVPRGKEPFPAVVFLHGSGAEIRWGASRFFADHVARRGIAALIYDKRGTGESTGDWRAADFSALADDALAGVDFLRDNGRIDPDGIGIYGHSQGGAMGPLVANRGAGRIAFVIAAAAAGLPMWRSEVHSLQSQVRALGTISGPALERADAFAERMVEVARAGGEGWGALRAAADSARTRGEPWIDLLDPAPADFYFWRWYASIAEYDPAEEWERITIPALVLEAEEDVYVPVEASVPRIEAALRKAGNRDYTIVVVPDAPHNFLVQPGPEEPFAWPRLAPGYTDLIAAWIRYRFAPPDG